MMRIMIPHIEIVPSVPRMFSHLVFNEAREEPAACLKILFTSNFEHAYFMLDLLMVYFKLSDSGVLALQFGVLTLEFDVLPQEFSILALELSIDVQNLCRVSAW